MADENKVHVANPKAGAHANPARNNATVVSMRLEIDPIVQRADEIAWFVEQELDGHPGLARVARCVAEAARKSKRVAKQLKRPIGLHRLPLVFLVMALGLLAIWTYWQFFHTSTLTIAIPERDAIELRSMARQKTRLRPLTTVGSSASVEQLQAGNADLAFIQGGVQIPESWLRMELDQSEIVLFYLRDHIQDVTGIKKILTSSEGQGSHQLALTFTRIWGIEDQVEYLYDWRIFTDDNAYVIPNDVDAIFVVKDPLNSKLDTTAKRLTNAGFHLASPDIGAMQLRLDFLKEFEIRPGYLDPAHNIPTQRVSSYSVVTYLVARDGLSLNQLNDAYRLVHPDKQFPSALEPDINTASEIAQGIEAILSILIYIGLTFLALLGMDVLAYRRRFHELNSLVSLISMHQSSKDVIFGSEALKAHHVTYLSVCSDLLGILSVITGYYTQENSSLMYNRLSDIIHERCDGLKINIQLKILHANIDFSDKSLGKETEHLNKSEFPIQATDSVVQAESTNL